ncbi:MAG: WD40 repeat domain-containing protein, partial [Planctomycetaceae bacterium]|nr:WD40 repeat domain-containing protein [Planctomycetaceae bacterium]
VRVWDLATGQIVEKHDGSKDAVVEVRFLEGDKRLLIRDRAGVVRIKPRTRVSTGDDDPPPQDIERAFQFITPPAIWNAGGESIPAATENGDAAERVQSQSELRNAASREARAAARQSLLKAKDPAAEESEVAKAAQVAALEKQLASAASDAFKADLKKQISRLKTVPVSQERTERPKLMGTLTTSFQFVAGPASQNRTGPRTVQLVIHGDAESLTATTSSASYDMDDERRKPADSAASQLWVWDIATQSLLRHWDDLRSAVGTCVFVDSTNQVLSSSGQVFSLPTGESRSLSSLAPETISAIATAPDSRHLAIGYAGSVQATTSVLRLFETATLQEIKSHETYEGLTTAIAFAPDGTSLAVAIRERQLHRLLILDATTLVVQATIEEQPHSAPWLQGTQSENRDRGLTTLRFSSDGRYLLTHGSYGSGDYRLTLWQKKGAKWTKETGVNSKASQPIVDDAQPPAPLWFVGGKGSQMAAISSKGLGIVDTSNGRLLRAVELASGTKDRNPIAWSSDGTWLVQGDDKGQVTLWNLRLDKEAAIFPAQLGPVKALALSSDGRVLATLGEENKLHLWNLENWQPKNRLAAKAKAAKPTSAE